MKNISGQDMASLGRGAYRLADVARYTRLPGRGVRSWFTVLAERGVPPVFVADYPFMDGTHVVSFLDLIDARVAGQLRGEGVPMRTVRAAYVALRDDLATEHPFAHSSLCTDGRHVFAEAADAVGDDTLSEVISRQGFFPRVKQTLSPIDYSSRSGLAERWNIAKGVVIDPGLSFGQPVILGTGVATYVVAASHAANGEDAGLVGELFGVTPEDVRNAVGFEESHALRRAA